MKTDQKSTPTSNIVIKKIKKLRLQKMYYKRSNCLNASKTQIGRKLLKDDNYDVDKMEEKYSRFMNGNIILRK